jgi:hypothetical protein
MDITYITTPPLNIPKRLESQLVVEAGHDGAVDEGLEVGTVVDTEKKGLVRRHEAKINNGNTCEVLGDVIGGLGTF